MYADLSYLLLSCFQIPKDYNLYDKALLQMEEQYRTIPVTQCILTCRPFLILLLLDTNDYYLLHKVLLQIEEQYRNITL